jgi:hypothetical protein
MRSTSTLFLLFLHSTAALECNITIMGGWVEVESVSMCNFVNYHAFMLSVFGPAAVLLLVVTAILFIGSRCVLTESVEQLGKTTILCFFLSLGLESWLVFLYLMMFFIFMCVPFSRVLSSFFRGSVPVVADDIVVQVAEPTAEEDEMADAFYAYTTCPICLETGGRRWYMTKCCHQFHTDCIGQWKQRTCPLCRGRT